MRTGSFFVILFMFGLFATAVKAQVKGNDIVGIWLNEDKDAHVKIENKNGVFYGNVVWLKTPIDDETGKPKLDKKNPDEQLKKRPIMGLTLLSNFKFDGDDEWEGGEIYDPKSGKTYSCYMAFTDDTKNILKVRGYIGISLIGRTTYWTKVE
ncbi:MAG: DUF2147 domain-containing protein [Bacteroidales bacterium]|nr:DUF2147 domain-containing protein [Bacteroidales bacterium]